MEYPKKSFTVPMAGDKEYRDNWERTFKKEEEPTKPDGLKRCPERDSNGVQCELYGPHVEHSAPSAMGLHNQKRKT